MEVLLQNSVSILSEEPILLQQLLNDPFERWDYAFVPALHFPSFCPQLSRHFL
jgi:hypothetical protein